MKLSFSTNGFVRYPVLEAVERIASIGYEGVELLADTPHLYADSVTTSDLEGLKRILDRTGLKVANINANTVTGYYGREFWEPLFEPSLAHPDESLRRWRVNYTKKCVDMAQTLNAPCVSVTSGRSAPRFSPEESLDFLRGSLRTLLEYAGDKSIQIGIEYEPGLLVERYGELAAIVEEIDSTYLGANLDLGHSHVLGEDPETVISGLSPNIFHTHVEDIRGGKHYHLIPGTGDIDFTRLFRVLHRHGYAGFATVELYTYPHQPDAAARQSFNYLQEILSELKDEVTMVNSLG